MMQVPENLDPVPKRRGRGKENHQPWNMMEVVGTPQRSKRQAQQTPSSIRAEGFSTQSSDLGTLEEFLGWAGARSSDPESGRLSTAEPALPEPAPWDPEYFVEPTPPPEE